MTSLPIRPADVTEKVALKALEVGYRHVSDNTNSVEQRTCADSPTSKIDCAKVYRNEAESAEAIRQSGLDRSKIFYTSKVPTSCMGYEQAKQAIGESLTAAKLDYIDLYTIPPVHELLYKTKI